MSILGKIKDAIVPQSYAMRKFGMEDMPFFVALLRACPVGSQITFDQSEPESFVRAFGQWAHRSDSKSFEADYYTVDAEFIALAEQLARRGELELDHHFGIASPDGRLLCASWDDFTIMKLADEIAEKFPNVAA